MDRFPHTRLDRHGDGEILLHGCPSLGGLHCPQSVFGGTTSEAGRLMITRETTALDHPIVFLLCKYCKIHSKASRSDVVLNILFTMKFQEIRGQVILPAILILCK